MISIYKRILREKLDTVDQKGRRKKQHTWYGSRI